MIQVAPKLAKDCIKADIPKTYKFQRKNNDFSCIQWSILVQSDAVCCHLGSKLTDFAPRWSKLERNSSQVGSRLLQVGPSWYQINATWCKMGSSCPKLGASWPKSAPSWPKLVPSGSTFVPSRPQSWVKDWSRLAPNWLKIA